MLATIALLYKSFFELHIDRLIELITLVLPYSNEDVQHMLVEFVRSATTIGGIGSVILLAVAFQLYLTIETTLNLVWSTTARRSPAIRMFSFTMVVFWGPVVMGLGSTALFWLGRQPWWETSSPLLISIGRVLIPLLGLTMVYWLAPHTGVNLSSAFCGGVTATLGIHLLRWGFVAYLRYFHNINIIYGSLYLAVIFLMSLYAFWTLVIVGAVTSYTVQNLWVLLRQRDNPRSASTPVTIVLALLAECYRRQRDGEPPPRLADLEDDLGISHATVYEMTEQLLNAGLLAVTGKHRNGFLPSREASQLTLADALCAVGLEGAQQVPGDGSCCDRLQLALEQAAEQRLSSLKEVQFSTLLETVPEQAKVNDNAAPESAAP